MSEGESTTIEQIAEYESQLAGIVELLEASPGDESLVALKKDMEELVKLSRANLAEIVETATKSLTGNMHEESKALNITTSEDLPVPLTSLPPAPSETNTGLSTTSEDKQPPPASLFPSNPTSEINIATSEINAASTSKKEKPHKGKKNSSSKKLKKVKDFVLPDHLQPNDEDTEAERNKKKRAAKALKNKWRLQKKEIESNNRQKSWQSFQRNSFSSSSGSIFATKEGLNDRVGVVSKKQLTTFGQRKRHK